MSGEHRPLISMDTPSPKEPLGEDPYREPAETPVQKMPAQQPIPEKHFSRNDMVLPSRAHGSIAEKKVLSPEELGQHIARKLTARAAFVSASGASPDTTTEQKVSPVRSALHAIRTYRGDVEDEVHTKNISMVSVVAAEEERKAKQKLKEDTRKKTVYATFFYIFGSIVLLGAGAAAVFYAYLASLPQDEAARISQKDEPLVFVERSQIVLIATSSRAALLSALTAAKNVENNTVGTFERLIVATSSTISNDLSSGDFFSLLEARISAPFIRSLGKPVLIGLHSYGKTVPFIVLSSVSYNQSFAGMLHWESSMREDLSPFIDPGATTTRATPFEDAVIRNRDARVVRDSSGKIIFLYAFPDEKTIVITEEADTLIEIVRRFGSTKSIGG